MAEWLARCGPVYRDLCVREWVGVVPGGDPVHVTSQGPHKHENSSLGEGIVLSRVWNVPGVRYRYARGYK